MLFTVITRSFLGGLKKKLLLLFHDQLAPLISGQFVICLPQDFFAFHLQVQQITKILNAHVVSLMWVERNSGKIIKYHTMGL